MKNGDYIRSLDDDKLARLLWIWGINYLSGFMKNGGSKLKNFSELRKWIDSEQFVCDETKVPDGFVFDQNFELREE